MMLKMDAQKSAAGGVKYAEGVEDITTAKTISCGFRPKTITYKTWDGTGSAPSYWQKIYYDVDLATYNGTEYQIVQYGSNNATSQTSLGDSTGGRIQTITDDGFTIGAGSSTYGLQCVYKVYG